MFTLVGVTHQFLYMPATVKSEFSLALNQVATERGIDPTVVLETIKAAILAAYRKDYGSIDIDTLEVELDPATGEAKVIKDKKDITPSGFGRIAAQTAKQVILQRIREAEKKAIIDDYSTKLGSITSGMVLRFDGPNVIVDLGRAECAMPPQEQIPGEHYKLNQRLTFYIAEIRESMKGNDIIVSRSHKGLVEGLFKREVPEVASGAVGIKEIAREAGKRTKIAVTSTQIGVDPVGSCVGQKGVRVQAVINELGGMEKIDIIQWNDDIKQFIQAALSPAKDIEVTLDEKKKTAIATISPDQLSLAIGKEGQNVRLAAKLTGYKIDIKGRGETVASEKPVEEEVASSEVTEAKAVTKTTETKKPKKKVAKKKEEAQETKSSDKKK